MRCSWKIILLGVVVNFIFAVITIVPIVVTKEFTTPSARGFDPADSTIALSVEKNTVSSNLAIWGSAIFAGFVILIIEAAIAFWQCRQLQNQEQSNASSAEASTKIIGQQQCQRGSCTTKVIWLESFLIFWLLIMLLMTSYGITGSVTNLCKTFVARPRPCFLNLCRPDYTILNSTACQICGSASKPGASWPVCVGCPFIPGDVAIKSVCQPENPAKWVDMWLSFPSGHASYSMCGVVFLAVYLYSRMRDSVIFSRYLVAGHPLIIFATLLFGIVTALSRVSDHKHHLSDVVTGAVLGSVVGFLISFTLALPILRKISSGNSCHNCENPQSPKTEVTSL